MTVPPPVNPIISIQPLQATGVSRDSTEIPNLLQNAKHGDVIEGFVINRDAKQNPILRTPQGDLLVKSDVFLKTGSTIQIRVDAQLESRARIIFIDGLSPQAYVQSLPKRQSGDVVLPSSITPKSLQAGLLNTAGSGQAIRIPAILLPGNQPLTATTQAAAPTSPLQAFGITANASTLANSFLQINIISANLPNQPTSNLSALELLQSIGVGTQTTGLASNPNSALTAGGAGSGAGSGTTALTGLLYPNLSHSANTTPPGTVAASTGLSASNATNAPVLTTQPQSASPTQLNAANPQPTSASIAVESSSNTPAATPTASTGNAALSAQLLARSGQAVPPPVPPSSQLPASYRPTPQPHLPPVTPTAADGAPESYSPSTAISQKAAPTTAHTTNLSTGNIIERQTNLSVDSAKTQTARVIGNEPDGASIISSNGQVFKLLTSKPLPVNTELKITLTLTNTPAEPTTNIPTRLAEFSSLAAHWPALEDAIQLFALAQANNPALTPANLAPNIGPALTSGLLFFLSAVRGGDLSQFWPRQVVDFLEKSKPELLQRLSQDGAHMQQLAAPQPYPNWSVFLIPLFFQNQPQHMRLYVRGDEDGNQATQDIRSQRFIMEVELSHLGEMQLDGLVQGDKGQKPKQFDLVIRSSKALPNTVESDIYQLFSNALQSTNLKGKLRFYVGRQHFVYPASELKEGPKPLDDDFTILA